MLHPEKQNFSKEALVIVVGAEWDSKLFLMHKVTLQGHTSGSGERTQVSQISINPVPVC